MTPDDLNHLRDLNQGLGEIRRRVTDLLVENGALKLKNDELRRTVDDLRRQLKAPPY